MYNIIKRIISNPYNLHENLPSHLTPVSHSTPLYPAHFEQSFLILKCPCKMVNTLPSDIFKVSAISHNFNLLSAKTILWILFFWNNCRIWATRTFNIIGVCTAAFKISKPLLYHLSQWSSRITLFKPLLCLNGIFPMKK